MVDFKLEKLLTDALKNANVGNNIVMIKTDSLGQIFIKPLDNSAVVDFKLEQIIINTLKDTNVGVNMVMVITDSLGQVFIKELDPESYDDDGNKIFRCSRCDTIIDDESDIYYGTCDDQPLCEECFDDLYY